ncbi:hypothetical protein GCM10010206_77390 [Streptomyces cinerochromogenes]|nr:hypothetical protein GCM10010206_77390 [Streptomyces cinerochromogenes]
MCVDGVDEGPDGRLAELGWLNRHGVRLTPLPRSRHPNATQDAPDGVGGARVGTREGPVRLSAGESP